MYGDDRQGVIDTGDMTFGARLPGPLALIGTDIPVADPGIGGPAPAIDQN